MMGYLADDFMTIDADHVNIKVVMNKRCHLCFVVVVFSPVSMDRGDFIKNRLR